MALILAAQITMQRANLGNESLIRKWECAVARLDASQARGEYPPLWSCVTILPATIPPGFALKR